MGSTRADRTFPGQASAVGQGHSNSEIASQLHMSLATVKAHVSRLLTKLNVPNRVQIALLVHDAATWHQQQTR